MCPSQPREGKRAVVQGLPASRWGRARAPYRGTGWGSALPLSVPEACKFQGNLFRPVEEDDATRLERKWGVALLLQAKECHVALVFFTFPEICLS